MRLELIRRLPGSSKSALKIHSHNHLGLKAESGKVVAWVCPSITWVSKQSKNIFWVSLRIT